MINRLINNTFVMCVGGISQGALCELGEVVQGGPQAGGAESHVQQLVAHGSVRTPPGANEP